MIFASAALLLIGIWQLVGLVTVRLNKTGNVSNRYLKLNNCHYRHPERAPLATPALPDETPSLVVMIGATSYNYLPIFLPGAAYNLKCTPADAAEGATDHATQRSATSLVHLVP